MQPPQLVQEILSAVRYAEAGENSVIANDELRRFEAKVQIEYRDEKQLCPQLLVAFMAVTEAGMKQLGAQLLLLARIGLSDKEIDEALARKSIAGPMQKSNGLPQPQKKPTGVGFRK